MSLFISFEGPDGSGKSTQARLLAEALRARGQAVCLTREPGGTELGEAVREMLLAPGSPPATPLAMAFLLSAARTQLVSEIILPALGKGHVVITDRFADSTVAYQSFGLGLDLQVVRDLTAIATDGVRPDLVIYLDVDPEVGLRRAAARGALNRLDAETSAFHRRVHEGYRELMSEEPDRWVTVDGSGDPDAIHRRILHAVHPYLDPAREPV